MSTPTASRYRAISSRTRKSMDRNSGFSSVSVFCSAFCSCRSTTTSSATFSFF